MPIQMRCVQSAQLVMLIPLHIPMKTKACPLPYCGQTQSPVHMGAPTEGHFPSNPNRTFRGHMEKASYLESNSKVVLQNNTALSGVISFFGASFPPSSHPNPIALLLSGFSETQGLRAEALPLLWRR